MASWMERPVSTSFRYARVDRLTGRETGQVRALSGGTITRNDDVRVKETAEFGIVDGIDFGPDLVRVYMGAEWTDGSTEEVVLGTFLPVVPGRSVRQGYSTATVRMYGRLQELYDDRFPAPVTISKGENAVGRAAQVCRDMGLEVVADDSDYAVTEVRLYGAGVQTNNSEVGDTKLDMVNDLLDLAGFRAAHTDPWGRVVMERYRDPADIAPSLAMEEGPDCKFEAAMEEERDYTSTANHVVVVYGPSEDGTTVTGEAWDRDPKSDLSTVRRGRTITKVYTYNDLPPGKTPQERQDYATNRAAKLLSTAQSVIRRVTARHPYMPFSLNDTVEIAYPSGGIEGKFQVRAQTMRLAGGCPTSTEFRQFRRRA